MEIAVQTELNYKDYVVWGPQFPQDKSQNFANITGFIYGAPGLIADGIACRNMASWKCIDGHCGIPVNHANNDVIYIPSGSTFSSFITEWHGGRVSGSVNFRVSGNPGLVTTIQTDSNKACFSHAGYPRSFYLNGDARLDFKVSLKWYIYAAKSAATRSITATSLSVTSVLGQTTTPPISIPSNNIVVKPKVDCSVLAPTTIDFGEININTISSGLLSSTRGDLTVNCSSTSALAKVDLSVYFKGNSEYGGNGKFLILKDEGNEPLAGIRGRLAPPLTGSCINNVRDDVSFNGSLGVKKSNVGVGQVIIPLAWSLCRENYSLRTGKGMAKATVTINWE